MVLKTVLYNLGQHRKCQRTILVHSALGFFFFHRQLLGKKTSPTSFPCQQQWDRVEGERSVFGELSLHLPAYSYV